MSHKKSKIELKFKKKETGDLLISHSIVIVLTGMRFNMIDNFAGNDLYNSINSLDSSDFQKFLAGNKSSILPDTATNRSTSLFID
jgi:hypothetical protein